MKSISGISVSRKGILVLLAVAALLIFLGLSVSKALDKDDDQFTKDFRLKDCTFQSEGSNPYFILGPGQQSVFEGKEGGKTVRLVITVLNETETINLPDIGDIETRVVEEKETADGNPVETSRNFFAICDKTNDV